MTENIEKNWNYNQTIEEHFKPIDAEKGKQSAIQRLKEIKQTSQCELVANYAGHYDKLINSIIDKNNKVMYETMNRFLTDT